MALVSTDQESIEDKIAGEMRPNPQHFCNRLHMTEFARITVIRMRD